jgi:non-heme Fe2+,alpha-ketoglutarate-dependent halogenase
MSSIILDLAASVWHLLNGKSPFPWTVSRGAESSLKNESHHFNRIHISRAEKTKIMLNSRQIAEYGKNGFLVGVDIMNESEATDIQGQFDELEAREGRKKCVVGLLDPHLRECFAWKLSTNEKILDCVEQVIGPDILLLSSRFFCKYGPSEKFVAWHQDVAYWGLDSNIAVLVWYAVDDSDAANGCMRVIPKTHDRVRGHGTSQQDGNMLSINQEISVTEAEENSAVNVELKAGSISLHHGCSIHGSLPNRSSRRRCGITSVFLPANVCQLEKDSMGEYWPAIQVRGENRGSNLDLNPHPF